MNEFINAVQFFIKTVNNLKDGKFDLQSPLEEIVLKTSADNLAYIDNRKDAKGKYGFDFWNGYQVDWLKKQGIKKAQLYSVSQQFPDFLFKVKKHEEGLIGGSIMELKDSKSATIASFNSTVPTKYKSLEEIDVINGKNLVSRIARVKDGNLALNEGYLKFSRKCFYLVRTHKENKNKVKVSIIDGSFFETVPKEHLFHQMFLNVLRSHLEKKEIIFPQKTLEKIEMALSHVTDQTIIASSQVIENASVRPRLRIMAEVHPEGNPHSKKFYPEITESSFNLILQSSPQVKELEKELSTNIPESEVFSIFHKRNGAHRVFQFRKETGLGQFL